MENHIFELQFKVRDYECDSQGIVNHAIYLHYFEHTRHEFLVACGISFLELQRIKITPVVSQADVHYKISLTGGDEFLSRLTVEKKGVKMIFFQEILRKRDLQLCCKGKIEVVTLLDGKLSRGDYFDDILHPFLKKAT